MPDKENDQELIEQVSRSQKYAQLASTLVARVTKEEAKKHNSQQDIIQSARSFAPIDRRISCSEDRLYAVAS